MGAQKKKLSILIPVYNEGKSIAGLIEKIYSIPLPQWEREIIIIDDGSTDKTKEILKKMEATHDVTVLYGEKNLGKGGALKHGLSFANGDWILIQDADFEYDPNDYPTLLAPIEHEETQVVFGSRFLKRNKRNSALYVLGDIVITSVFNHMYHTHLTDLATCYKIFPKSIIPSLLTIEENDFVFDVIRLSEEIAKQNLPIKEVPISYTPRWYKEGKKLTIHHGIKIAKFIFKKFLHGK